MNQGPAIDLTRRYGAQGAYAASYEGSFFTGVLWVEDTGWMTFDQFFRKQGGAGVAFSWLCPFVDD